jgi:hypothetical protein
VLAVRGGRCPGASGVHVQGWRVYEKESLVRAGGRTIPVCLRNTESDTSKIMYLLQENHACVKLTITCIKYGYIKRANDKTIFYDT